MAAPFFLVGADFTTFGSFEMEGVNEVEEDDCFCARGVDVFGKVARVDESMLRLEKFAEDDLNVDVTLS